MSFYRLGFPALQVWIDVGLPTSTPRDIERTGGEGGQRGTTEANRRDHCLASSDWTSLRASSARSLPPPSSRFIGISDMLSQLQGFFYQFLQFSSNFTLFHLIVPSFTEFHRCLFSLIWKFCSQFPTIFQLKTQFRQ